MRRFATRADTVQSGWWGRSQQMLDDGKSGDEIAASLFKDIPENKAFLGLHPKEQQKMLLQLAEQWNTRGQHDVARSLLNYQRKDGAYQGSLVTDRELGEKANDLMDRINREQQQTQLATSSAAEEEGVYVQAMKLSNQGSVNDILDVQVHDKQGNLKTISADSIRKEVARRTIDDIGAKARYRAKTPEEAAALASKLEKESFIGNGLEQEWLCLHDN